MAFIIILFMIVLSKCSSCSKDKRELQEEPITPIAPVERLTNTTLLYEGERSFVSELYLAVLRSLLFCIFVIVLPKVLMIDNTYTSHHINL